ncbi:MAG: class I SAM-dependent methyltransferase [Clostridiales bacterium]|nr:class I SAM-dependent methyltransferase [Clostridiales bacterium]
MYTGFAEVYDELMGEVNYRNWAELYCDLMAHYGITKGKVCECACGTGALTIPLYRKGFHMTGVDISQEMLWIAAQKARKDGIAIPFVRQDMRELHLHRPMDAVLATCDGVNYLLKEEDVLAFFRSAFQALRPGGGLFFDISTPYKLEHKLGNQIICDDSEHITYFWQNAYHPATHLIDMHLCFFVRQDDGSYKRIDEEQKQRAWTAAEIEELLRSVGFDRISVFGNGHLNPPREKEDRWHFAAMRRVPLEDM